MFCYFIYSDRKSPYSSLVACLFCPIFCISSYLFAITSLSSAYLCWLLDFLYLIHIIRMVDWGWCKSNISWWLLLYWFWWHSIVLSVLFQRFFQSVYWIRGEIREVSFWFISSIRWHRSHDFIIKSTYSTNMHIIYSG